MTSHERKSETMSAIYAAASGFDPPPPTWQVSHLQADIGFCHYWKGYCWEGGLTLTENRHPV
jgi:hypothetical protein